MNKKERKQEARRLIFNYPIGKSFSPEDVHTFSQICGYDFTSVERIQPKIGSSPSVSVVCPSIGYQGAWSWVKSIDGYDESKNVDQAMREASRRGSFSEVSLDRCASCGRSDRLSVDHRPSPFSEIKRLFIKQYGIPEIRHVGQGWELIDAEKFLAFHDLIADYQVLCISCNSAKGNRQ